MKRTCEGRLRGGCGKTHDSWEAAQACCDKDAAAVHRAFPDLFPVLANSDRRPVPVDDEAKRWEAREP